MTQPTAFSAAGDTTAPEWWRSAVIYQIYPRSFADANGDGVGDLAGIAGRMDALETLGVDAVWLSPFMRSPQKDAGYDVTDYMSVDPLFGTLDDFDAMLASAHRRGIKVIVDLVPNHSSDTHEWFIEALAAAPGSAERGRYLFRDGKGENGELPPNNWESVFGGPAWTRTTNPDGTPGEWFLHLFDSTQPDFDWTNPEVREMFRGVLRFWLNRGVDGFRVDVAHGMIKAEGLPDYTPNPGGGSMGGDDFEVPYWGQEGVHEIYRDWHKVLAEYEGDRVLAAEAWINPLSKMAKWVRPDEMHQAFNFPYLETAWDAKALRPVIDESLEAFGAVGAPSTWVLSNHDVVRHASRLALTAENPQGHGIGPKSPGQPMREVGLQRARAASAFMLALPGGAYMYQGEELGLPEVINLPDEARQDPTWFRTNGERYGRDGCRVPLPWEPGTTAYGFNTTGEAWLPQPDDWDDYSRAAQQGVAGSTLTMYTTALELRKRLALGLGSVTWIENLPETVIGFRNGDVIVLGNTATTDWEIPAELAALPQLLSSTAVTGSILPGDATVWLQA
ncbi:alpha-amylase [Mycetocola tolaasinivorans]|uniref:Alpha-amylase n=1 Tax=Mycetocola tolaasinivorans TaxID=76635 RepID=A0A3L7ABC2_9MICO|nr:glycoside hydrolase family 13 protein [Mycetocola tolaasinivorans]RLP77295.1 alpha-amylase [Mycetocola tolaasinivorans]